MVGDEEVQSLRTSAPVVAEHEHIPKRAWPALLVTERYSRPLWIQRQRPCPGIGVRSPRIPPWICLTIIASEQGRRRRWQRVGPLLSLARRGPLATSAERCLGIMTAMATGLVASLRSAA